MTRVVSLHGQATGETKGEFAEVLGISAWGEPMPGRRIRSCELSFRKERRAVVDSFKVVLYEVMTEVMASFF